MASFVHASRSLFRALRLLTRPELVRWLASSAAKQAVIDDFRVRNHTCYIDDDLVFHVDLNQALSCGERVRIAKGCVIACSVEPGARAALSIGSGVYVGEYCNFRGEAGHRIQIGDNCRIAQFCSFIASNHSTEKAVALSSDKVDLSRHGITIGNDVWIGAACVVLPGAVISDGAIIGANSVVNTTIPAFEIWGGVPARRIGVRQ